MEASFLKTIDPFVRMMRLKRSNTLSGKWRDIDNVFTYIASGSGDFIIDGIKYSLHTGNAIIIPPYKTHIIVSQGVEPLVQYIIHFDFFETPERLKLVHKDVLDQADEELRLSAQEQLLEQHVIIVEIPEAERNDMMRKYLAMLREFQEERPCKGRMLKAECVEILISTLRNGNLAAPDLEMARKKKTKSWVLIEKTIQYINQCRLNDNLDNESIASAIGSTPNYLTKVFQDYLGMSLHKYIVNYKIEKAQQLLLSGKYNITETSEKTGFSSIHAFSKTFKNVLGVSPTEFLDQTVSREQLYEEGIRLLLEKM